MTMDQLQPKLNRIRLPRLRVTYPVEGCPVPELELPFLVGVLADLSGHPQPPLPPLIHRKAIAIDRDNFDNVLSRSGVRLALRVPNRLTDANPELAVELNFKYMDDFEPAGVARQISPLRQLMEARDDLIRLLCRLEGNDKLEDILTDILEQVIQSKQDTSRDPEANLKRWIADIDVKVTAQLNEVMHDPGFQHLEATWRGLHYLAYESETDFGLQIRVLNVSKRELLEDAAQSVEFHNSALYRHLYEEEDRRPEGQPYGIFIGDYEFGPSVEDVGLLKLISQVAAAAHAPFVAAASPKMFRMECFDEFAKPRDLASVFESVEFGAWNSFRESDESHYTALTLPRVPARLPYGSAFGCEPVEEFNYEEMVGSDAACPCLWMSAAWAYAVCVTTAISKHGCLYLTCGLETGGKVQGFRQFVGSRERADAENKRLTEVLFNDRREYELSKLGFLPLSCLKDIDQPIFMSAHSCRKPKVASSPNEGYAHLNVTMCAARFVHTLIVMLRGKPASLQVADCETWLTTWIQRYVAGAGSSQGIPWYVRPLREAQVRVRPRAGKPGSWEMATTLQFDIHPLCLEPPLTIVAEIPSNFLG